MLRRKRPSDYLPAALIPTIAEQGTSMLKLNRSTNALIALLASTALAAPALAQPDPPTVVSLDDNGVDLISAQLFFSMSEGSIGSGAYQAADGTPTEQSQTSGEEE
jgi:hypothetical protein